MEQQLHIGKFLRIIKADPVLCDYQKMIDISGGSWYDKDRNRSAISERVMVMALAQATKSRETTYTINDAMDVLLSKLDEAIDDMENGRVQTVEEAWAEIDAV